MREISKNDVEMEKVESQISGENVVKAEGKKTPKSSFDTRVKTAVVEALHLTKVVKPVCEKHTVRRKNESGKREMREEIRYTFEAYVLDDNSPYSGMKSSAYSEQDAFNKLNDALFDKAKSINELLYWQTVDKLNKKKTNVSKAKTKEKNETVANSQVEENSTGKAA